MYSSFWSDLKHTFITQWWVLLVLGFVLSVNVILKVNAADDVETVYYLEFCGNQLQMFREFVKLDGSKICTDQNCILVNHPAMFDIDSAGNDSQLISQYIISNQYFEVLENEKIIKPSVKIGNLYAAKIHDCFDNDLCMLQGGTLLFDGSDTLENEIALFYNAEIENLVYEDTSLGSTDIEHASVIEPVQEPEPVQEDPVQEQEPEPVQEDPVQEPEPVQEIPVEEDPVQEPEPVREDPVQEQEPEPVQEDPVQEQEPEPVQEDPVQEQEPVQEIPVEEDPVQEPEPVQEVKQSTTIVRSASSSGNVSTKQSNATATYSDSMEGSPVVKSTNTTSQSSSVSTAKAVETEKEDESISSDSGNASTAKTSIDGEENVDDTTLHNDNIMLTVTLFVLGGLGAAMGITRLML